MLTIGQITYANCTPIFHELLKEVPADRYRMVRGVPAVLNGMLRQGEIDLCPSSSIEYGRRADRYYLLPDLSISAIGPVKSVFLFSRVPIAELGGQIIGLTSESETSVVLLRILLQKYHGVTARFEPTSGLTAGEILAQSSEPVQLERMVAGLRDKALPQRPTAGIVATAGGLADIDDVKALLAAPGVLYVKEEAHAADQ